ncbi:MAG TPA: hypothetical protein VI386_17810 [Candidatus Sulfotelmatobacter sp.]
MTTAVKFAVTRAETVLIGRIVARAKRLRKGQQFDGTAAYMDITACHANGCPLKLQELLDADDFNFMHDFYGIEQCIDRRTGELQKPFHPRFAQTQG